MNEQIKTFECGDLYAAAYIATKAKLLTTAQSGQRTIFQFSNEENISSDAAIAYINDLHLRNYLAALREMKAISYAARKS